ncbi:MAG: hypothetical protein AAF206_20650 [Bacteroidota bacterium]
MFQNALNHRFLAAVLALLFFSVQTNQASAQPWLDAINAEIDELENLVAACRADIKDFQEEIDALIKNTPPPITGTPTEQKIRDLQKKRALWRCWGEQREKDIRRLKVIRGILKKRWGTADTGTQSYIKRTENKVNKVEREIKATQAAGQKLESTIHSVLGEQRK